MIILEENTLRFFFPNVHQAAEMRLDLQRTLRIPDDSNEYPLPPGLGTFPLRHMEDFSERLGADLAKRGGVLLPMHPSEALWINFGGGHPGADGTTTSTHEESLPYPFALKIAAGKINIVTGEPWRDELSADRQDYIVVPGQPWIDGFAIAKGVIRQFVAEQLGKGYSVEEQLTGEAKFGGIQIIAYPMKANRYQTLLSDFHDRRRAEMRRRLSDVLRRIEAAAEPHRQILTILEPLRDQAHSLLDDPNARIRSLNAAIQEMEIRLAEISEKYRSAFLEDCDVRFQRPQFCRIRRNDDAMGFAPGGRMRQQIYEDPHGLEVWDQSVSSRCFITFINAHAWPEITNEPMPTKAPSARDYTKAKLPWFEYYAPHQESLPGSSTLSKLVSWAKAKSAAGDTSNSNESITPENIVTLSGKSSYAQGIVREPDF